MKYVVPSEENGKMTEKIVHISGKRKTAIARTTIKKGEGIVRINSIPLDKISNNLMKMKVQEAILIASDQVNPNSINIDVNVFGGGVMGQSDAVASSIARGMVKWAGSDELLSSYLAYERTLIAGDYRLTEVHKPSQSSKGPRHKRQKSYR